MRESIYAFLLFLPVLLLVPIYRAYPEARSWSAGVPMELFVTAYACIFAGALALSLPSRRQRFRRTNSLFLGALGLELGLLAFGVLRWLSVGDLPFFVIAWMPLIVFLAALPPDTPGITFLRLVVLGLAIVGGLTTILEKSSIFYRTARSIDAQGPRAVAGTQNLIEWLPSGMPLGLMALFSLVFVLAGRLCAQRAGLGLLCILITYVSESRSLFVVALVIACLVTLAYRNGPPRMPERLRNQVVLAFGIPLIFFITSVSLGAMSATRFIGRAADGSPYVLAQRHLFVDLLSGRPLNWGYHWEIFRSGKDFVLGDSLAGIAAHLGELNRLRLSMGFEVLPPNLASAHNQFLGQLSEFGLVGSIALLSFFGLSFLVMIRSRARFAGAAFLFCLGILLVGVAEGPLAWSEVSIGLALWNMVLLITLPMAGDSTPKEVPADPSSEVSSAPQ